MDIHLSHPTLSNVAPKDKVEDRNADYAKIMRTLKFKNTSTAAAAGDGAKGSAAGAGMEGV